MMRHELVLAIDCGTQSLKVLIFNLEGQLLAKTQTAFETYTSKRPGWAEQDPRDFWHTLCLTCQRLWQDHPELKDQIAGVALTTQRATVVNLDRDGHPLRPAILWLDQRKARGIPPMQGPWGWLFKITRLDSTIAYFQSEAEANWIAAHQPDLWRQTHKYLLLSGYLTYRLTGAFVDSTGCQVGYIPFDYKKMRWAPDWDWKWRCLPIKREMLPELIPPGQLLGRITPSAAEASGIPVGLPLIAAAADKACEVLGSGGLAPSVGCLSFGTAATINITHNRYIEPIPLLPAYPSAIPEHHSIEVQIYRGYWMVSWFKEQFGHQERKRAQALGVSPESLFENLVKEIPPGSMGLMLQPYWTPGVKSPGPAAKGSVIGFGDVHTRAHLYRSILEGLAFGLRAGKDRIEKRCKTSITHLIISGGGSQSDQAMQITADVFGLPATRPHLYETSGLGAAIDAAVGLGLHSDFETAVKAMTHAGLQFEPRLEAHKIYDALYREVYQHLYPRLRPLYKRIREITGYPP